jgi:post-segregation antitoxin (ccd killing protein)
MLTLRVPDELADWLTEQSRKTGLPVSRLIREQLEKARQNEETRPFMRHAGSFDGARELSRKKGFSR